MSDTGGIVFTGDCCTKDIGFFLLLALVVVIGPELGVFLAGHLDQVGKQK